MSCAHEELGCRPVQLAVSEIHAFFVQCILQERGNARAEADRDRDHASGREWQAERDPKKKGLAEPTDMVDPESQAPVASQTENLDVEWLRAQCEQLRSELKKQDEAWQSAWLDNSRLRDINNGLRRCNCHRGCQQAKHKGQAAHTHACMTGP